MSARLIHRSASRARNEARELLATVFAAELLQPSRTLWIVSPWLRDIPVLDNRSGAYVSLGPDLPRAEVRLTRVLRELVSRGTRLVIACRPSPDGGDVGEVVRDATGGGAVTVRRMPELHVKGLLGDRYALTGSMNFTYNGIENLTELLQFDTDAAQVAALRAQFRAHYGDGT